jgi:hypothetical protein
VVAPDGAFDAQTEDVGSRGCQVVSPKLVRKGESLGLTLSCEKLPDALRVTGKVAWVSPQPPWRVGVAFDERHAAESARWFERLVAACPGVGAFGRVPERIPLDAMVYLGPPPRFLVDFTPDEALLLRAIASGARIDELMVRLRDRWPTAQRALFSLLTRQAVTLARGHAAHPDAWKKILTDVEASLAIAALGTESTLAAPPETHVDLAGPEPAPGPPAPVRPVAPHGAGRSAAPGESPWGTPPRNPDRMLDLPEGGPALDVAPPTSVPRGAGRSEPGWGNRREGIPTEAWRGSARARSPEAQELYERALRDIQAGNVNGALALLRQAITLAPGDAQIAEALGRLAFKDRIPGAR